MTNTRSFLLAALLLAAPSAAFPQATMVTTSDDHKPRADFDISGSHIIGVLDSSHLPLNAGFYSLDISGGGLNVQGATDFSAGSALTIGGVQGHNSIFAVDGSGLPEYISLAPGQSIRRNSAGTAFEGFVPPPAFLTDGLIAEYRLTEGTGYWGVNAAHSSGVPTSLFPTGDEARTFSYQNVTGRVGLDACGNLLAGRWTVAAGSAGAGQISNPGPLPQGTHYVMTVDVESANGTAQSISQFYNDTYHADIAIPATGRQRIVSTWLQNTGDPQIGVYLQPSTGAACDLYVSRFRLEVGTVPSDDATSNANLGWLRQNSTPVWNGQGLDFSAACGSATVTMPNTAFARATIYALVKWPLGNAAPNNGVIGIFGGSYDNNDPYIHAVQNAGVGTPQFSFGGTTAGGGLGNLHDGNWHLLTGIYDGSNVHLYLEEMQLSSQAAANLPPHVLTNFEVAAVEQSAGYGFPGQVAYLAAFNVAHSAAQQRVQRNAIYAFAATKGITIADLAAKVVFEGDSITNGNDSSYNGANGTNDPYPSQVMPLITPITQATNFAVSSAVITDGVDAAGANTLMARAAGVDALVNPASQKNILSVLIGINDLKNNAPATVFAHLQTYVTARRAAGWNKIIVGTILPSLRYLADGVTPINPSRNALNALIRPWVAATPGLVLSDYAADPVMGPDSAALNTAYYPDFTHPSGDGHALLRPIIQAAIGVALTTP